MDAGQAHVLCSRQWAGVLDLFELGSEMAQSFRGGVFISYRRKLDEKAGHATKLKKALTAILGDNRVFLDEYSIEEGKSIPDKITQALNVAHVILFVISQGWVEEILAKLSLREAQGMGSNVQQEVIADWVLLEAETVASRVKCQSRPPDIYLLLVDEDVAPSSEVLLRLPEAVQCLWNIKGHALGPAWDEESEVFKKLALQIQARLPKQDGFDLKGDGVLENLAGNARQRIESGLISWKSIRALDDFSVTWGKSTARLQAETALHALIDLAEAVLDVMSRRQLAELKGSERGDLKTELQDLTMTLLRLGACGIACEFSDFGDEIWTAPFEQLIVQVAVVASRQGRATRFSDASLAVGEPAFEGVLDQQTVTAGADDDKKRNICVQIWESLPHLAGRPSPFTGKQFESLTSTDVRKLATQLELRTLSGKARVAVGMTRHQGASEEIRQFRELMLRLGLDVEVLARTGKAATPGDNQEEMLLTAAWNCLNQINLTFNDAVAK